MRSFAFLLLLTVIFLCGLLIGIDRDKPVTEPTQDAENQSDLVIHKEKSDENKSDEILFVNATPVSSEHLTQKTASFLESGVKIFYDVIVEVLYQISSLAF